MALVRTRQQQLVRRIVGYTFLTDIVASGAVYLLFSHFLGMIVFITGLVVSGVTYMNLRRVMHVKGLR